MDEYIKTDVKSLVLDSGCIVAYTSLNTPKAIHCLQWDKIIKCKRVCENNNEIL